MTEEATYERARKDIEDFASDLIIKWSQEYGVRPPAVRLSFQPWFMYAEAYVDFGREIEPPRILIPEPNVVIAWLKDRELTKRALIRSLNHEFFHHLQHEKSLVRRYIKPNLYAQVTASMFATRRTGMTKAEAIKTWDDLLKDHWKAFEHSRPRTRAMDRLIKKFLK